MEVKPLNLAELNKSEDEPKHYLNCLLCEESFNISDEVKSYLSHLLTKHYLLISDIDKIGDLER
jgi:hypothetical protein